MIHDARDFRRAYLDHDAITAVLQHWAEQHPDITRLSSLGTTPEGRTIWLLTIGADPDRTRPAVWVDGNMHGTELATSNAALAIAEAALTLHNEGAVADVPEALLTTLRQVHVHVAPRLSPDGAEAVLARGGFVRSAPRTAYGDSDAPHWVPRDLDGDGRCRYLRVHDPAGDFVESDAWPGLMVPRSPEDPPPWYRIYPEGEIAHFDGTTIPSPEPLANTPDLNRNFPWDWRPEPEQTGAGLHPGSEPESAAVLRFASRHPNLFAWLNLHTFGGVFIRPLGNAADSAMEAGDLRIYRQLEQWADAIVGYPTVSGYAEFTYEPGKPLHGDLTDYAYHQRGCLAQVCELWDLFRHIGMGSRRPFVDHYTTAARADMERLAAWDHAHNDGRLVGAWTPLEHPQLGHVEVGGPDPVIGVWNPPPDELPDLCDRISRYWLRVAALLPRPVIEAVEITHLEDQLLEVEVTVANHGYLPTWGLDSARELPWNTGIVAELDPLGCRLAHPENRRRNVGHLEGWGRGIGDGGHMPWFQRSRGNPQRRRLRWLVHGEGTLHLEVGNQRVGWLEHTISAR